MTMSSQKNDQSRHVVFCNAKFPRGRRSRAARSRCVVRGSHFAPPRSASNLHSSSLAVPMSDSTCAKGPKRSVAKPLKDKTKVTPTSTASSPESGGQNLLTDAFCITHMMCVDSLCVYMCRETHSETFDLTCYMLCRLTGKNRMRMCAIWAVSNIWSWPKDWDQCGLQW